MIDYGAIWQEKKAHLLSVHLVSPPSNLKSLDIEISNRMLSIVTKTALLALFAAGSYAQSPVSQATYDNFVRYTAFSAAAYGEKCQIPAYGSSVVQYFVNTTTDTHATLFRDDATKELIIAFRGTASPQGLDADLDALQVPLSATGTSAPAALVHRGFQNSWNSICSAVTSAIQQSGNGYSLTVTGHSLGGGIAAIATSSLIGQGVSVAATYTFGEPRNGDSNWVAYIESQIPCANYFRVAHANDGVPQIPPTVLGYEHHGQEYWESKLSGNSASTTYKCETDSKNCNAGQDPGSSAINGAHITYSDTVIGSSLFIAACGAVFP